MKTTDAISAVSDVKNVINNQIILSLQRMGDADVGSAVALKVTKLQSVVTELADACNETPTVTSSDATKTDSDPSKD